MEDAVAGLSKRPRRQPPQSSGGDDRGRDPGPPETQRPVKRARCGARKRTVPYVLPIAAQQTPARDASGDRRGDDGMAAAAAVRFFACDPAAVPALPSEILHAIFSIYVDLEAPSRRGFLQHFVALFRISKMVEAVLDTEHFWVKIAKTLWRGIDAVRPVCRASRGIVDAVKAASSQAEALAKIHSTLLVPRLAGADPFALRGNRPPPYFGDPSALVPPSKRLVCAALWYLDRPSNAHDVMRFVLCARMLPAAPALCFSFAASLPIPSEPPLLSQHELSDLEAQAEEDEEEEGDGHALGSLVAALRSEQERLVWSAELIALALREKHGIYAEPFLQLARAHLPPLELLLPAVRHRGEATSPRGGGGSGLGAKDVGQGGLRRAGASYATRRAIADSASPLDWRTARCAARHAVPRACTEVERTVAGAHASELATKSPLVRAFFLVYYRALLRHDPFVLWTIVSLARVCKELNWLFDRHGGIAWYPLCGWFSAGLDHLGACSLNRHALSRQLGAECVLDTERIERGAADAPDPSAAGAESPCDSEDARDPRLVSDDDDDAAAGPVDADIELLGPHHLARYDPTCDYRSLLIRTVALRCRLPPDRVFAVLNSRAFEPPAASARDRRTLAAGAGRSSAGPFAYCGSLGDYLALLQDSADAAYAEYCKVRCQAKLNDDTLYYLARHAARARYGARPMCTTTTAQS